MLAARDRHLWRGLAASPVLAAIDVDSDDGMTHVCIVSLWAEYRAKSTIVCAERCDGLTCWLENDGEPLRLTAAAVAVAARQAARVIDAPGRRFVP